MASVSGWAERVGCLCKPEPSQPNPTVYPQGESCLLGLVLGSFLPDRMMAIIMQYIRKRLHYGAS